MPTKEAEAFCMIQAPPFDSPQRGEILPDITKLCGETEFSPLGGDADEGGKSISA